MSPDHETPAPVMPATNPTLAEDDRFRQTIEPAVGPNVDGPMNQIVHTHPPRDEEGNPLPRGDASGDASGEPVKTEAAIDTAMADVRHAVESSMHQEG